MIETKMVRSSIDQSSDVAASLFDVRTGIVRAEGDFSRKAGAVTLVAVSKTMEAARIRPALLAGQLVFGENRVQEAAGKWPALRREFSGIDLHLIGPLQTNKLKEAITLFDVIETLDRQRLAEALVAERARGAKLPRLLVQINTGSEPQKAGILPGEADHFIARCLGEWALPVEGLMCIPPADQPPSPHFALVGEIARRHGLSILSMGMSADFEAAIQLGATHVRIGSAIFGSRIK